MDLEQRVIELETRVAFQDDMIHTLSDTIARQQFQLESLQRHIQELAERTKAHQSQIRDIQQETPPPHY